MNPTGTRAVASDWIDERTRLVYEANKVGRVACLFFEELEHLLRHTYARGQQDMARRCAEAIHESVREVAQFRRLSIGMWGTWRNLWRDEPSRMLDSSLTNSPHG